MTGSRSGSASASSDASPDTASSSGVTASGPIVPVGGVGGSSEWVVKAYNALTVSLGSRVRFGYTPVHNVQLMKDKTAFDSCNFGGATEIGSLTAGATAQGVLWTAATVGTYYVSCSVGAHCHNDQKIVIHVVKDTNSDSSSASSSAASSTAASSTVSSASVGSSASSAASSASDSVSSVSEVGSSASSAAGSTSSSGSVSSARQSCINTPAPPGAAAPAQHFNLTAFKLQTHLPKCDGSPTGVREIKWPELADYNSSDFFVNSTNGAMIFITDVDGETTSAGATYPRTELREQQQWLIHSGWHYLTGRASVNRLPQGKESVVVAQVKPQSFSTPVLKLRAQVYTSTRPAYRLEARVKVNNQGGSVDEVGLAFTRNFQLGEPFNFTITMHGLLLSVTVAAAGEPAQTVTHNYTGSNAFDTNPGIDDYYFKAGSYCQSNEHKSPLGEKCEVAFFALSHGHAEKPPAASRETPSKNITFRCPSVPCVLPKGITVFLPQSTTSSVLTLSSITAGGSVPVARSYAGHAWEYVTGSTANNLAPLGCSPAHCNVTVSTVAAGSYEVDSYNHSLSSAILAANISAASVTAARFLTQATFGPTRDTVRNLSSALSLISRRSQSQDQVLQQWVHAQMALPATLHRAYARQRGNPRLIGSVTVGKPRPACTPGTLT